VFARASVVEVVAARVALAGFVISTSRLRESIE